MDNELSARGDFFAAGGRPLVLPSPCSRLSALRPLASCSCTEMARLEPQRDAAGLNPRYAQHRSLNSIGRVAAKASDDRVMKSSASSWILKPARGLCSVGLRSGLGPACSAGWKAAGDPEKLTG